MKSLFSSQERPVSATQRFYGAAEDVYSVNYYRILKASPHDAHLALAGLSIPSAASAFFRLLSTNPNSLSISHRTPMVFAAAIEEALRQAGVRKWTRRQLKMHGSFYRTICTQCKCAKWTDVTPLAPIFDDANLLSSEGQDINIPVGSLPRCGGLNWSG
jgi:NAD-dependent deacetylase sirtuin 5